MKPFFSLKLLTFLAVLFLLNASLQTSVFATSPANLGVSPFGGPNSSANWVNNTSVAETGGFAMFVSTAPNGFGGVLYRGVNGLTLFQLKHLGFDIKMISTSGGSPSFAAGAPRLSIILSNGVTLFPDPFYCSDISGTASATMYVKFDVVTDGANCTVFASTSGTNPVGSWTDVLKAYGSVPISLIFMIQDAPNGTLYLGTMFAGCASISAPSQNSKLPILGSCT
jgi:hypothetical protein